MPESRPHSGTEYFCVIVCVSATILSPKLGDTAHMVKIQEWTDEEVKLLRDLYTSNKTFEEIVERFPKRTENAIRLKASRLGIKRPILGNVIHVQPLMYKSGKGDDLSGYLMKCKECGSWIQVDDDSRNRSTVISCNKCGNLYQVLTDL